MQILETHPFPGLVVESTCHIYGSGHILDCKRASYVPARDLVSNTRSWNKTNIINILFVRLPALTVKRMYTLLMFSYVYICMWTIMKQNKRKIEIFKTRLTTKGIRQRVFGNEAGPSQKKAVKLFMSGWQV